MIIAVYCGDQHWFMVTMGSYMNGGGGLAMSVAQRGNMWLRERRRWSKID